MGELAHSLLTAPCRKELLILAGDIESNPGPYTNYIGKDLCIELLHIRHLATCSQANVIIMKNYLMWYAQYNVV